MSLHEGEHQTMISDTEMLSFTIKSFWLQDSLQLPELVISITLSFWVRYQSAQYPTHGLKCPSPVPLSAASHPSTKHPQRQEKNPSGLQHFNSH